MRDANIAVNAIKKEDVFHWWLLLTSPFNKLTSREMRVVEAFLKEEYNLRKNISDISLAREFLYSTKSRKKIMDEVGLDQSQFNNMLTGLRKKGIFKGKELNVSLFPNISTDAKDFKIIFQFKFNG